MSLEDFTTYTEVDPSSRIAVYSTSVDNNGLNRPDNAYVYADKGVGFYTGDFEFQFEIYCQSSSWGIYSHFTLANEIATYNLITGDKLFISVYKGTSLTLYYRAAGVGGSKSTTLSANSSYWMTLKRVGGTLTLDIYSDSARIVLVTTLSITNANIPSYRYIYPCSNNYTGISGSRQAYGKTKNIEYIEASSSALITPDNLTHTQTIEQVTLTQHSILPTNSLLHALSIDAAVLTQHSALSLYDLSHSVTIDEVTLAQHNSVNPNVVNHSQAIDNAVLIANGSLSLNSLTHNHNIDLALLTQHYIISADDLLHGHALNASVLIPAGTLSLANLTHSHSVDLSSLSQHHQIAVNNLLHNVTLGESSLVQHFVLSANSLTHSETLSSVTISSFTGISPTGLEHSQSIDLAVITQHHVINPNDLTQSHEISNIVLSVPQNVTLSDIQAQITALTDIVNAMQCGVTAQDKTDIINGISGLTLGEYLALKE